MAAELVVSGRDVELVRRVVRQHERERRNAYVKHPTPELRKQWLNAEKLVEVLGARLERRREPKAVKPRKNPVAS